MSKDKSINLLLKQKNIISNQAEFINKHFPQKNIIKPIPAPRTKNIIKLLPAPQKNYIKKMVQKYENIIKKSIKKTPTYGFRKPKKKVKNLNQN